MHDQAYNWVTEQIESRDLGKCERVLDLGGRDVNGNVHSYFPQAPKVRVLDLVPGDDVDIVADAATWEPDDEYQVVLCTEVFEHTYAWRSILHTAQKALAPGGVLLATCASRRRPPHSALDGGALRRGEWYQNVNPDEMRAALAAGGWSLYEVIPADGVFGDDDLYVVAFR